MFYYLKMVLLYHNLFYYYLNLGILDLGLKHLLDLIEYLLTEIKKNEKKFPSKASALVSRLKHFYEYLSEEDKKEALKISELRKYINLKN